jgi:hypothetical protein
MLPQSLFYAFGQVPQSLKRLAGRIKAAKTAWGFKCLLDVLRKDRGSLPLTCFRRTSCVNYTELVFINLED